MTSDQEILLTGLVRGDFSCFDALLDSLEDDGLFRTWHYLQHCNSYEERNTGLDMFIWALWRHLGLKPQRDSIYFDTFHTGLFNYLITRCYSRVLCDRGLSWEDYWTRP